MWSRARLQWSPQKPLRIIINRFTFSHWTSIKGFVYLKMQNDWSLWKTAPSATPSKALGPKPSDVIALTLYLNWSKFWTVYLVFDDKAADDVQQLSIEMSLKRHCCWQRSLTKKRAIISWNVSGSYFWTVTFRSMYRSDLIWTSV